MRQVNPFSDERLLDKCVYCGGKADTADHVPSKIFIDEPYPENMPVVPACKGCNLGFSLDEQYLSCLIDFARTGATSPEDSTLREKTRETLQHTPKLAAHLMDQRVLGANGAISFGFNKERVKTVILKLARGHAAYKLSEPKHHAPDRLWYCPIYSLSEGERSLFNADQYSAIMPEIGSRGFQNMAISAGSGIACTNWEEVQKGRYKYIATVSLGVLIKFVINDYLACEVFWE